MFSYTTLPNSSLRLAINLHSFRAHSYQMYGRLLSSVKPKSVVLLLSNV